MIRNNKEKPKATPRVLKDSFNNDLAERRTVTDRGSLV